MGVPKEAQLPAELAPTDVGAWLRGQAAFRAPRSPAHDEAPARRSTGFGELDRLLGGVFLRGQISELVGSGGRTSLALGTLAAATRAGEVVAWVDGADALDPLSVRGAGVALERF